MTIWKWSLKITDEQTIDMPGDAEVLCVQMQGGQLCMWACVDPEAPKSVCHIRIVGTGHRLGRAERDTLNYVGTVQTAGQTAGGSLVWHVFIRK